MILIGLEMAESPSGDLKVGYVSTGITVFAVQVIQDQQIPEKHDLSIEFVGFTSPSAMNNSFVAKAFDVNLAAGASVMARARDQGYDVQYFFPTLINSVSVIVPDTSPVVSLAELTGEKIGWYGLQSGGGTAFYVIAHELGLDVRRDFQMIDARPPALWPLLDRGEVRAIVIFEPFVSRMLATGSYRELIGPFWHEWEKKTGKKMELSGLAAFRSWLDSNEEYAQKLVAIWIEVAQYIKAHPREVLTRYAEFTKFDSEREIELGLERIPVLLNSEWGEIDQSIAQVLSILAADKVIIDRLPEELMRRVDY